MKKANDQVMRNANMMAMSNVNFNEASMRAGGHLKEYTPPSERALQTFDMGGDLKTHWGGYAEPISDNPYAKSPTVMFRGQSHDESDGKGRSGIGMTYGNSPVEVERGEPAQEFRDGGTEKSLVVFGNLPISNVLLPLLGDPDAKGKKFKNYVADFKTCNCICGWKFNKDVDYLFENRNEIILELVETEWDQTVHLLKKAAQPKDFHKYFVSFEQKWEQTLNFK